MIWRCPRCRGELVAIREAVRCTSCASSYDTIGGIPDLRVPGASWIDDAADRAQARRLFEEMATLSTEDLVRHIYRARPDGDDVRTAWRTRQVMTAPERLRRDLHGGLQTCTTGDGVFLDVGCGPGMMLAAAAAESRQGIGIDVSMVWLVVAQRLIADWGGRPVLAAALAEALPLRDEAVCGAVSLDVMEHVADPKPYLREISRVVKPGGWVVLSTPNRYSLAAEPHVQVWGVGWLPRVWQQGYVTWRSGKPYAFVRLLSVWETARLLRRHTRFQFDIQVPPVPPDEIVHFPAYRAILARVYNRLLACRWLRGVFMMIGPFFRVVGHKP